MSQIQSHGTVGLRKLQYSSSNYLSITGCEFCKFRPGNFATGNRSVTDDKELYFNIGQDTPRSLTHSGILHILLRGCHAY
jgi:hypothetical protein